MLDRQASCSPPACRRPAAALIFNGLLFVLLATGVLCVVAVGFASLTTSRAGAIVTLIAWQIVASPLLSSISSLGSARRLILSQAIAHFSPVSAEGRHGATRRRCRPAPR